MNEYWINRLASAADADEALSVANSYLRATLAKTTPGPELDAIRQRIARKLIEEAEDIRKQWHS